MTAYWLGVATPFAIAYLAAGIAFAIQCWGASPSRRVGAPIMRRWSTFLPLLTIAVPLWPLAWVLMVSSRDRKERAIYQLDVDDCIAAGEPVEYWMRPTWRGRIRKFTRR